MKKGNQKFKAILEQHHKAPFQFDHAWHERMVDKSSKRSRKLREVLIAGWTQVTDFVVQYAKVQTAGELLTAREWLEEEFGRLAQKGIRCKIVQHPDRPTLIALYKEIR